MSKTFKLNFEYNTPLPNKMADSLSDTPVSPVKESGPLSKMSREGWQSKELKTRAVMALQAVVNENEKQKADTSPSLNTDLKSIADQEM